MNEKETSILTDLMTKFGFPIICCLALMWYVQDTQKDYREEVKIREDRQHKQIENFNTTMRDFNNTLISIDKRMQKLEGN